MSTLKSVLAYFFTKRIEHEIIVVDDGSFDQTSVLLEGFPSVKKISFLNNQGKGAAVKKGVSEATGDFILFMDADNSTKIAELDRFLKITEDGHDIVIGSRALSGSSVLPQPWLKKIAGKLGNKAIQLLLLPGIKDTQCGFKLFTKKTLRIFNQQTLSGFGFDFEILWLAKKSGYTVAEAPVEWINHPRSTVKTSDYFKTLRDLLKVRFNNLKGKYSIEPIWTKLNTLGRRTEKTF